MFSFVARPNSPIATVKLEILDSKERMVTLKIRIEADLTQVYSPIKSHAIIFRGDLKILLINHVSRKIRKSIKAFAGEVGLVNTYDTYSVMEIHFSDIEKKGEWLKYADESEQRSVEAFNKECSTALEKIWPLVVCRASDDKISGALRESLKNLQEGTDF